MGVVLGFNGGGVYGLCILCCIVHLLPGAATANVVLMGRNVSLSFDDAEANFAPTIQSSGECGFLFLAEPLDACSVLTNEVSDSPRSPFTLIIRGGCAFDEKVRNAQKAGFKAAIIYDNEDNKALVAMPGNSAGIAVYAIFISKASGKVLKNYAGLSGIDLWIIPNFETSAWSTIAISLISLVAISAVLVTYFFVRRHRARVRPEHPRASCAPEFDGMSRRLVKAMPSLVFTSVPVVEDSCTSTTCAICLEDYNVGDMLRILPCCHKFHAFCVDSWLTSWRTFCPVCKQDAQTSINNPPASESTPLLPSGHASPFSAAGISSFHSSVATSATIAIMPSPSRSPLMSQTQSVSSTPHASNQLRSYYSSPAVHMSRSPADLRNMSSQSSHASYLMPSHSLGLRMASSLHSRFESPHLQYSGNGSPSYLVGSSSRLSCP